ncbi:MAG: DUF896 domain-containing protein [Lachnospiraceae bacterium]|nr:DUF896 domain-containing protein [Lachnospiraceae bacterium]
MTEADIKRINELYHKSQNEGLTDEEKEEQQQLRSAYIQAMRGNIRSQLDSIVVQRPDGTREKLKKKKK